jgi:ABC-2 type transport system permease protein
VIVARGFVTERRRSLRWWAIAVIGLVAFTVAFYPSVRGQASFDEVYDDLPASMRAMFGTTAGIGITSPRGYLQARLFGSLFPVVLLVLAIGSAVRATAGAEEDGTLEQLIVLPVTRRRAMLERAAATGLVTAAAGLVALLALVVLGPVFGATDGIGVSSLAAATTSAVALAWFHGALAFGIGASTGRRALASGITGAVAVGGFLLQGLLASSDPPGWALWSSPWHWYLGSPALVDGWTWPMIAIPLAATAVLVALGTARFETRDLR